MTRINLRVPADAAQSMDDMMKNLIAVKGERHASVVRVGVAIKQLGGLVHTICEYGPPELERFAMIAVQDLGAEILGELRFAHGMLDTPRDTIEDIVKDAKMVYDHGHEIAMQCINQKGL
jgi:hypothetical protein